MNTSTNLSSVVPSLCPSVLVDTWDETLLLLMWTYGGLRSHFDGLHADRRGRVTSLFVWRLTKDHDVCAVSALLHGLPVYLALLMSFSWVEVLGVHRSHVVVVIEKGFFCFLQNQPSEAIWHLLISMCRYCLRWFCLKELWLWVWLKVKPWNSDVQRSFFQNSVGQSRGIQAN